MKLHTTLVRMVQLQMLSAIQEGTDLFHSYITRESRSYAEILFEFTSVNLPLGSLLAFLDIFTKNTYCNYSCSGRLFAEVSSATQTEVLLHFIVFIGDTGSVRIDGGGG